MKIFFALFFFVQIVTLSANSQSLEYFNLGNFALESGNIIYDCEIGYRTFGSLNQDSSNVIIFLPWLGGTSAMLTDLIGPRKIVDDTEFFIIAIDFPGNGISTSPSNSSNQPGSEFPELSIGDMVEAQYRLLTDHFGFQQIHGAVGGSIGGMQIFEWIVRYPGYIQRAVPYTASPKLTSYDLMVFKYRRQLIETGLRHNVSEQEIMTLINLHAEIHNRTPDYIHRRKETDEIDAFIDSFDRVPPSHLTVHNYLVQIKAVLGHDISKNFGGSLVQAAERIDASVLILVAGNDHLLHPAPSIEFARMINAGLTVFDNDCGHFAIGCELEKNSQLIQAFLSF